MGKLVNNDGLTNSLQISKLGNIPAGNFKLGLYFLVKNITDNNITIQVKMPGANDFISTVFYPGWNVELVEEIKGVTKGQLQYGY